MEQSDISFETFEKIINEFPELQHIELQGEGEPLLHPQFFDMAKLAQSRGIRISMITNGSMFTSQRIDKILECGIEALQISIESPKPKDFYEIRGGKLEKVIDGIKALLKARNDRGQKYPAVGFAVTVLNRTKEMFPLIVDLYKQLGMDGKMSVQPLNLMESYTRIYGEAMSQEFVSKEDQALFLLKYAEFLQFYKGFKSNIKHFYEELVSNAEFLPFLEEKANKAANTAFRTDFRSCPWLDGALYVDRNGVITPCCSIKDEKNALGKIGENSIDEILQNRSKMREQVRGGIVPEPCRKCALAELITSRLSSLLPKKPQLAETPSFGKFNKSNVLENLDSGVISNKDIISESILELCDGETTCSGIIDKLSQRWKLNMDEGQVKILPVIEELICREVISV
jgi:radical SAM protein with 4Fe4S-binding SPASM domain